MSYSIISTIRRVHRIAKLTRKENDLQYLLNLRKGKRESREWMVRGHPSILHGLT